jgi:hypothetical protein
MIEITVPYDLGRLAPNLKLNRWELQRRKKVAQGAAWFAYLQAGCPEMEGKVRVTLRIRRGRRMDPDNVLAAAKIPLDVLFCRNRNGKGITPDDSDLYVEYAPVEQMPAAMWKGREEFRVTVEPLEERP